MHIFYNICVILLGNHAFSFFSKSQHVYIFSERRDRKQMRFSTERIWLGGKRQDSYQLYLHRYHHIFCQITMFIKVHVAFVLINTFYQNLSIRGYEDKRKGHCDLSNPSIHIHPSTNQYILQIYIPNNPRLCSKIGKKALYL